MKLVISEERRTQGCRPTHIDNYMRHALGGLDPKHNKPAAHCCSLLQIGLCVDLQKNLLYYAQGTLGKSNGGTDLSPPVGVPVLKGWAALFGTGARFGF